MADGSTAKMVFLGFGKYARADKIYLVEPITDDAARAAAAARSSGSRACPSRSSPRVPSGRSCTRWGRTPPAGSQLLDQALDLAERLAEQTESGKVDLADLGRRARRLLESTSKPSGPQQLF